MNVLGVSFDSKLNWRSHIQIAITKSQKALQAIRIIKKTFHKKGTLFTCIVKLLLNLILQLPNLAYSEPLKRHKKHSVVIVCKTTENLLPTLP